MKSHSKKSALTFSIIFIAVIAALTSGTFAIASHREQINQEIQRKSEGKVALSAEELVDVVKKANITAYWLGPISGYRYSLVSINEVETYIRYLPAGASAKSTNLLYPIIATYSVPNAFKNVQKAAGAKDAYGVLTSDGSAVYYKLARPTNVYIAFKDSDLQVEIYNPDPNIAFGTAIFADNFKLVN